MKKVLYPNKTYLILWGDHPTLEESLTRMGDRVGFRVIKPENLDEFNDFLQRIVRLAGMVCCTDDGVIPVMPNGQKPIIINPEEPILESMKRIDAHLSSTFPDKLIELIENAVEEVSSKVLSGPLHNLQRNVDFGLRFSYMVSCDATADGCSVKATCEADFKKMSQYYSSLKQRSERQLVDAFGELCNQILGVINVGLKGVGLTPLISLPIGAELSANGKVSQVKFMPMIRFVDAHGAISIGVSLMIDSKSSVNWGQLITTASKGEMEFF